MNNDQQIVYTPSDDQAPEQGKSKKPIPEQVKKLLREGKPKNQAVAIAMSKAREDEIARMKAYRKKIER